MAILGLFRLFERSSKAFLLFYFLESSYMSILHRIAQKETWKAFHQSKVESGYLQPGESRGLACFIEKGMYLPCVEKILAGKPFSYQGQDEEEGKSSHTLEEQERHGGQHGSEGIHQKVQQETVSQ